MKQYEMVTVSKYFKKRNQTFFIKVTQEYLPDVDMGHYKFVVMAVPYGGCQMEEGDVLKAAFSSCAPPDGKMDEAWVGRLFKDFYRDYMQYKRYLRKSRP